MYFIKVVLVNAMHIYIIVKFNDQFLSHKAQKDLTSCSFGYFYVFNPLFLLSLIPLLSHRAQFLSQFFEYACVTCTQCKTFTCFLCVFCLPSLGYSLKYLSHMTLYEKQSSLDWYPLSSLPVYFFPMEMVIRFVTWSGNCSIFFNENLSKTESSVHCSNSRT